MVNQKKTADFPDGKGGDLRTRILLALRNTDGVVSGETLSGEFSVSRVAIWKQIQALRENGYRIASTRRGYRIDDSADVVSAADFAGEIPLIHYPSISSTMDAAALSAEGSGRTLFVADVQESGRGRLDRKWESAPGGLYATLRVKTDIPLVHAWRYGLAAVLSLRAAVRSLYGAEASVKWPNDLLSNGKKIAGVLLEVIAESALARELRIGIGLNANNVPPLPESDSLARILGRPVLRREALTAFLSEFSRREPFIAGEELLAEWKSCSTTLKRSVEVSSARRVFRGIALDLDPTGALVVETAPGIRELVYAGDIHYR